MIRAEIRKEMLFLLPALAGALLFGALFLYSKPFATFSQRLMEIRFLNAFLAAALGALIGGMLVWLARILGTLAMGRVAMGLGDVHLMFGIGAIIGAGPVAIAFFLAPFAGLVHGVWRLMFRRSRELPYGPYLALASAAILLCYCPIADYLRPGMLGLAEALRGLAGAGGRG
jgi:leader peptidase (prepilin peptidase)/N-methyltransferase